MLIYKGNRSDVIEAVAISNDLIESGEIEGIIKSKFLFEYTTESSKDIAAWFSIHKHVHKEITVKCLWKPWQLKTKAIHSRKGIIINSRKIKDIPSLCGTLAHEFTHHIDSLVKGSFGHGDNSSAEKENSVPYYVGRKTEETVRRMMVEKSQ